MKLNRKLLEIGIGSALLAGSLSGCATTSSSVRLNVFGEEIMKTIIYSSTPQKEKDDLYLDNRGVGLYYQVKVK